MAAKQFQLDMSKGSIFKNTIRFAIPLIFASLLQLFYNAADLIIVSRYAGSNAMASVGATSSVTNLLVNVFIGLSLGASVVVSRKFGANDRAGMKKTVHTAMLLGGGIDILYLCWPISWLLVSVLHTITLMIIKPRAIKRMRIS